MRPITFSFQHTYVYAVNNPWLQNGHNSLARWAETVLIDSGACVTMA